MGVVMRARFRRATAALFTSVCMLLFAGDAAAREVVLKPGKARWVIKTSVPVGVDLDHGAAISFADFIRLPDPPGAVKNNRRFSKHRYPAAPGYPPEGTIVTVEGWLQLVALEKDGDYHVQISARPEDGNNCIIVEVPKDASAFELDPDLRNRSARVRERVREVLPRNAEPPDRGVLVPRRVRVRVTGQLFFDDAHVGDPPRGKRGMKAATLWEIHPITAIELFPQ